MEKRGQGASEAGKRGSGEGGEGERRKAKGARFNPAGGGTRQKMEEAELRQNINSAMIKSIETNIVTGVTQDKVQTSSIDLVSLNPVAGQRGRGNEADSSSQKGGGEKGSGEGKEGGGGTGKGSGSSGGEAGSRAHEYRYVREIVMKLLKYPEKARRMGLEGRVIMSFIITEAGLARDIKVVESSGFQMLDDAAREAISRVNLSRRSDPHRLIVHLPVEFRLR